MLPSNKDTFKLHLEELKTLVSASVTPDLIIRAVLKNWIAKLKLDFLTQHHEKDHPLKSEYVVKFSNWLENHCDILEGAFWLTSAFAGLLEKDFQKANAMYFTPPYLSNRMLDNTGELLFTSKLIDPACGGGAFLAPAAFRISNHMKAQGLSSDNILSHIEGNLFGIEANPFLAELSRIFLTMVLAEVILETGRTPNFNIICGDGLTYPLNASATFDLVLSNPPYRKMIRDEVEPLLSQYGSIIEGQPNLYSVFIKRAIDLVQADGKIILLTPMSFLSGKSFSKLRKIMVNEGRVDRLDLIHNKQGVFLGAEQDAVITVWEKRISEIKSKIHMLSLKEEAVFTGEVKLPHFGTPWPIPRDLSDAELMEAFSINLYSLTSYGYRTRTGSIVVHRDKRKRFANREDGAQSIRIMPLIWQRDIGTDGKFDFLESETINDRYIDMGPNQTSAIIDRPAIAMHRVTSPNQSRRLICALIPEKFRAQFGGVTGENHICFIVQENDNPLVPIQVLSEILRTRTLNRLFISISGVTNVSAYELNRLPLPNPVSLLKAIDDGKTIEDAVRIGLGLQVNLGGQNG